MGGLISVIIPVYNAEKYLRKCLDSVLNQTYKNLEIIAVNDGSTDNSLQILNDYALKYGNILVVDKENGGVCSARNVGIEKARGEYLTFLDSDDFFIDTALEVLYDNLIKNQADIASGLLCANASELKFDENYPIEIWENTLLLEKCLLDNRFTYSSCAKLFRADFLKDVRFVEGKKIHEDSYFVFCLSLKQPKFVACDVYIYNYSINENSASHANFSEKYFDILYFAEQKYKCIEIQYRELIDSAKNMLVKANLAMLQCFLNTKNKSYKKDIIKCKKVVRENSKYFIPAIIGDKKRFLIVKYHLYDFYRFIYQIKYKERVSK